MDWKPKAQISAEPAESEPTKPSKPGSVGFEGAAPAESPEIDTGPEGRPPVNVLAEMERHPAEPWRVQGRMLNERDRCSEGIGWAEWKAAAVNRLFQEQGVAGMPGRITAATVRHGERKAGSNG